MLLNSCYQPTLWDIYWRLDPCDFVMRKVEREKGLFGTSAISRAWLQAMLRHPVAYLQHRSAFMWNFLAADNLVMWTADVEHPTRKVFADRAAFNAMVSAHDMLKPTPLLRAGFWLLACIVVCWCGLAAKPVRAKPHSRLAFAVRRRSMCCASMPWAWRLIFAMDIGPCWQAWPVVSSFGPGELKGPNQRLKQPNAALVQPLRSSSCSRRRKRWAVS